MTCLEGHKSKSIDRLCPECVGFDIETLQREIYKLRAFKDVSIALQREITELKQAVRELANALKKELQPFFGEYPGYEDILNNHLKNPTVQRILREGERNGPQNSA